MVSVVIPTHNRADLLSRAIDSVLRQDIKEDMEIIVVSDGSTDETADVVKKYDPNMVRFFEYFPGVNGNRARNVGVQNALGEYVAFLDDDDAWMPDKLSKQFKAMRVAESGLSYTGVNIIYEYEKVSYHSIPKQEGDLSTTILLDNCIGSTSTVLVKKDLLLQCGGFDEELGALQDYDLWIRLCQKTKVSVVGEPLVNYYNYTNKKQVSSSTQKYVDAFCKIESKYPWLFDTLDGQQCKERLVNKYALLANKCLRNGNRKEARPYIQGIRAEGFWKTAVKFWAVSMLPYKYVLKLRSKIQRNS